MLFEPKKILKSVKFVAAFLFFAAISLAQENVLVVVNENSADSVAIGHYYAAKRSVPNICRIRTSVSETISREGFEREILAPVAGYLRSHSLQDRILYIVTTRGIPSIVGDDLASVDSELTLVYHYMLVGNFSHQRRIENPYFAIGGNLRPFQRSDFDIYLVTRLTSLDLVDRSLLPETGGDYYFDLVSPQKSDESDWVQEAAAALKKAGLNATVENTAKELDNLIGVQGYVTQSAKDAPLIKWRSGALATILNKDAGPSAASYLASGVTGFGTYTADPLPDGYFRPQILFPAYAAGYNLAEAFYASSRYLGWRSIVIGDPLVAPYAKSARAKQTISMDPETGLPEQFARRRIAYLQQKYSTSRQAILLLLRAEVAESKGDRAGALALADKSLEVDPLFSDAQLLKSRLAEVEVAKSEPKAPEPVASAPDPAPDPAPSVSVNYPVRLVSQTPIEYPLEAKQARVQGVVLVNLLIDEMGQVMKAEIVRGDRRLAKAVLDSVKMWRFEPELENGRPIVSRLTLPIAFKLKIATNSTN